MPKQLDQTPRNSSVGERQHEDYQYEQFRNRPSQRSKRLKENEYYKDRIENNVRSYLDQVQDRIIS